MPHDRTCSRPRCPHKAKQHNASGYCEKHYQQLEHGGYVPSAHVLDHIRALRERGYGLNEIVDLCGIPYETLWKINKRGPTKNVQRRTAESILAIRIPNKIINAGGKMVPAIGTHRRIRALSALGWTQPAIATESGLTRACIKSALDYERVTAKTAAAIAETFERLQWHRAPRSPVSARVQAHAARMGWPPPFAWDEESIDDPAAEPCIAEKLSTEEWHAELAGELSDEEIARELGIKPSSLQRTLQRAS